MNINEVTYNEDGMILDVLSGASLKDTPEERVRQRFINILHYDYGYPKELMQQLGTDFVVTGPWDCRDALFNYTDSIVFPEIVCLDKHDENIAEFVAEKVKRYNADKAILDKNGAKYCFYDKRYCDEHKNCWINRDKKPLKRYDATLKKEKKSKYGAKPWNRK